MKRIDLLEQLKIAYKKVKSNIYFDKTCSINKDKIVEFEVTDIDRKLSLMCEVLKNKDSNDWNKYQDAILNKIEAYSFPKKVTVSKNVKEKSNIILNKLSKNMDIRIDSEDDVQYFINLPIEGHILGVLWILRLGKDIDNKFYEHSYGNRILESEKSDITYSPYLFKPYFNEYESWRDRGLKVAEQCYENKKDSIILMLDIKRFYYSVNFTKTVFDELLNLYCCKNKKHTVNNKINDRLHGFIFEVIRKYSEIMKSVTKSSKNILPIGFMPSSILSNWYLDQFDKDIVNKINPTYYGRYVDDLIIVDKIEQNSEIYNILNNENLGLNEIIENYFIKCNPSIFYKSNEDEKVVYNLKFEDKFHDEKSGDLQIQQEKIKILYLKKEGTKTLLDKFKFEIRKNSSEFRLLPEDKELFLNSYSEIYKLNKSDSVNKLRGIENIEIDKYEFSKFIGKQLTISNLIEDDKESKFYDDIAKIYDRDVVIKNFMTWEAILSLCVTNYRLDKFQELFKIIKDSIDDMDIDKVNKSEKKIKSIKETLNEHLKIAVIRSLSLIWSKNVKKVIKQLYGAEKVCTEINEKRKQYCLTRMSNKMLMPILVDALLKKEKQLSDNASKVKRLNKVEDCLNIWRTESEITKKTQKDTDEFDSVISELKIYKYHPYMITYQDLTRLNILCSIKNSKVVKDHIDYIKKDKSDEIKFKSLKNEIEKKYMEINYNECNYNSYYKTYSKKIEPHSKKIIANIINVGKEELKKFKIAVATTNLSEENFNGALTDKPVRTLERYNELAEIINQAVKCNVNMLVLPESYVPYEWLTLLEREAKKNNLAIITGVEHIKYNQQVYNLIATILPYEVEKCKYVYTNFRTKVTYSPEEIRQINGYRLKEVEGNEYNLFIWNNVWIPVYCCFEIASILDRSIFYSLSDLFVVVEWNRDINYFSNIIESLSRDIHCYCVQVNSAEYGDSCIIKPSKTDNKSIVRTKGGINNSILVGEIDIAALRNFQIKEYELQKEDKSFKPTPPVFNKDNVDLRIKNELFTKLWRKEYGYRYFKEKY